jgi:protease-4
MARTRDVVVGVIIVLGFLIGLMVMAFMFIGMMSGGGDLNLTGLGGNIGVVEVFGVVDEYSGRKAIEQINDWVDKGSIKAIVLHVVSPGGEVAISQEMHDAVLRARERKPVVASMGAVAASGGLYVAVASDRIVANPGTLTGSIGVIMQFWQADKLMEKVGVEFETVKSGEFKDVGTLDRQMTAQEHLMLRSVVMDTYEQFVQAVSEGRSMDPDRVRELADGAIYTGHQALNYGLVDTLGGLHEAVQMAADLAGITGEPKIVRPYEPRELTIFDFLGGLLRLDPARTGGIGEGPRLMYLYR